jgi:ABC-type glycerol-3-phosphate transport system permease component
MIKKSSILETFKTSILLGVSFFIFIPFYFMLVISVKDPMQFAHKPFVPTWPLHFENYQAAWQYVGPYIGRTIFVAGVTTFCAVFLGSLCAFVFARFRFTGKKVFFFYIVVLMMIPGILNLIPLYSLVTRIDTVLRDMSRTFNVALSLNHVGMPLNLRFLNTTWVLIIPGLAGAQIMMIYVLRTFFESQPRELFEAARLDGASDVQTYLHVALPLARPIIGVMAIMLITGIWNDYVWPLVVLQRDHYTVSVGLKFMEGQAYIEYGPLMAGYAMTAVPLLIVYVFAMRMFIEGLSSGAIKM